MEITKETILERIDLQGVWQSRKDTVKEWFEYVLSTLWQEDRISTKEFDESSKITDVNLMILEIKNFAELYEYDFIIIENGKEFSFDDFGNVTQL